MTDTAPQKRERDVQYGLKVIDQLPETARTYRSSPIEDALDKIVAETNVHGKWVQVVSYGKSGAASAQANELRKRHGYKPSYQGWEVAVAREADNGDGSPRTGLFVKYDPALVSENGPQEQESEEAKRKARAATRKPRSPRETDKKTAGKAAQSPPQRQAS